MPPIWDALALPATRKPGKKGTMRARLAHARAFRPRLPAGDPSPVTAMPHDARGFRCCSRAPRGLALRPCGAKRKRRLYARPLITSLRAPYPIAPIPRSSNHHRLQWLARLGRMDLPSTRHRSPQTWGNTRLAETKREMSSTHLNAPNRSLGIESWTTALPTETRTGCFDPRERKGRLRPIGQYNLDQSR